MREPSTGRPLDLPTPLVPIDVRSLSRIRHTGFTSHEAPTARFAVSPDERFLSLEDGTVLDADRTPVLDAPRGDLVWARLSDVCVTLILRIDGETTVRELLASMDGAREEAALALLQMARDEIIHFT